MGCLILCMSVAATAEPPGPQWKVIKSQHFLIQYVGEASFEKRVSIAAESYYQSIARDLGFTRHDNFWTWDNRAKVFIYPSPSPSSFQSATKSPEWAAGKATHSKGEIASYRGCKGFLDSVLPHELSHLNFRDFVAFEGQVPLWLNEGIAQCEEKNKRKNSEGLVRHFLSQGKGIPLAQLTRMDVRSLGNTDRAAAFYAQSIRLVGFMISCHGSTVFRWLCTP